MVDLYKKWQSRIEHEESEHKKFRQHAQDALKVYEAETDSISKKSKVIFPILRNVVEVQTGLITTKQPQAKMSKRFDNDQTQICMKMERAVNYFIETGSMQTEATEAFEDFLTAGLGGMRVKYDDDGEEVEIIQQPAIDPNTQQPIIDPMTSQPVMMEVEVSEIANQRLWAERFEWCNFHWEPCKRWSDCDWIAFCQSMTLREFRSEYDVYPSKYVKDEDSPGKADIKVYEIWDRESRTRLFWSDMHENILDEDDDPFETDGFYPCDEPMFFACLHDTYEPRPEFHFWKDLHDKVQELTRRETALIEGIIDVEFYDQTAFPDIVQLENATDGKKIPVDLSVYQIEGRQGNINDVIAPKDHTSRMVVLDKISVKRDELFDKIYQTTGIADIMQAVSDPRETMGAQNLKSSWGSARLARKRFTFDNHIRGTLEVMTNIMAKLFTNKNLSLAAGMDFSQEEYDYLKQSDEYRIDVETLSTLSVDKDRDQKNAIELTNSVAGLFTQGVNIPAPITQALLKNTVKTFPDGRDLEVALESLPQYIDAVQQLQQQLQQMQGELQNLTNQNMAMAGELNNYNQVKAQKDAAEAGKKVAETEKIKVETVQKGNEIVVDQMALADERIAYQQQPVQLNY